MSGQVPEAAVTQAVRDLHDDYSVDMEVGEYGATAIWATPEEATRTVLAAAYPHIRRAVIEELAEKAEARSAEAYSGFDMIPQHLKGFPEGQRQRSLGVQANHAHWWLRAELEGDDRG